MVDLLWHVVRYSIKNTTIKLDSALLGLNHPGNGEALAFCGVHFFGIKTRRGGLSQGRIEVAICNREGKLDSTNQYQSRKTPQSTSVCRGGG